MSVKKQTLLGLSWTFLDTFFIRGLTFVALIFLARLLGPEEFGLIGMISVFIGIGKTLSDSGLTNSLIRTKDPVDKDYSTVFIVNIIISIVVYLSIYFLSPSISTFFDQPILIGVIRLYSLVFIITALSATHIAILTKSMSFKKITIISMPSTIIGVVTGLLLGYYGYGVWSIVWLYLSTEIIRCLLFWIYSLWRPSLMFSLEKFKFHYVFGYKLMLSGLLNAIFENVYNVIIGKYYTPAVLGYYERSRQFVKYPSATFTGVISKVTYPLLAKYFGQDDQLRILYKKLIRVSFFIISPCMLGISAVAKPLFNLILGDEWLPAVIFFQILCFAMMLYPIHTFNLNILKVYGRSDLFLKIEVLKKIIISLTILVSFQFGVIGLVWGSVFTSYISLIINMYYSNKIINYSILDQIKDLSSSFILSILMFYITYILVQYLGTWNIYWQIIIPLTIGLSFYFSIMYLLKNSPLHESLSILKINL